MMIYFSALAADANIRQTRREKSTMQMNTIITGDCREILPTIRGVDCVVTDPPYFLPAAHYSVRGETSKSIGDLSILEHYFRGLLKEIYDCLTPEGVAYVFCDGQSYPIFHRVGYSQWKRVRPLIWDKGQRAMHFADAEIAWTNFNRSTARVLVMHIAAGDSKGSKVHPTQKPIKLYSWLLQNYAEKGQRILDTHGGSFSSAIAAHYFGVDFVACEIDKDYFEKGKARFEKETRQIAMF